MKSCKSLKIILANLSPSIFWLFIRIDYPHLSQESNLKEEKVFRNILDVFFIWGSLFKYKIYIFSVGDEFNI